MARKPRTTPARRAAPAAAPDAQAPAAPAPEKSADELQAPVAAEGAEAAVVPAAPPAAGVADTAAASAVATDAGTGSAAETAPPADTAEAAAEDVYAAAAQVMAEEVPETTTITIAWPSCLGPTENLSARIQQAIADAIASIIDDEHPGHDRRDFGPTPTFNGVQFAQTVPSTEVEEWTPPPPPYVVAGMPVMFREQNRRFNGLPTTPAIVTRVYPDMVVNLMVLPDGGEPYPRLAVGYEETLDPEAIGRAWTHIQF